jgi:hypothetical protein
MPKQVVRKDEILKTGAIPSARGEVDATSKNIAEGILEQERTSWPEMFLTNPSARPM